ncbi:MAG: hypothetical protein IKF79_05340 [Methanosphaera sp.]|jgi:hypothetical protein|nr:hypothetical protein [Methanosphaera sp.]
MENNNITHLIHKYYTPDEANLTANNKKTPGERHTPTYRKQQKQEANRKHRHNLLTQLLKETPFKLTKIQEQQIRYWIDTFNPYWKHFHRQASNETILLAFIMIQQKHSNPRLQVENYTISHKYELNNNTLLLIQNRLIFELMRTTPLTYNQSLHLNHEILNKGELENGFSSKYK